VKTGDDFGHDFAGNEVDDGNRSLARDVANRIDLHFGAAACGTGQLPGPGPAPAPVADVSPGADDDNVVGRNADIKRAFQFPCAGVELTEAIGKIQRHI